MYVSSDAQPCKFFEPGMEDTFHSGRPGPPYVDPVEDLDEIDSRPELVLERVGGTGGAPEHDMFPEDHRPGDDGGDAEHGHDELNRKTRVQHQCDEREISAQARAPAARRWGYREAGTTRRRRSRL